MAKYTPIEKIAITASKEVEDKDNVFAGVGLPVLVTNFAKRQHAPNAVYIMETGCVRRTSPDVLPLTVDDPAGAYKADKTFGAIDSFGATQRGEVDISFVGGAQVDKYGNLNSTGFGNWKERDFRYLVGSGGANPMGSLGLNSIAIMGLHEKRRLVEKVDYLTTPGWLYPPDYRKGTALPTNRGPSVILTSDAIFRYDEETHEAYIDAISEDVTLEEVKEKTGWEPVKTADEVKTIPEPTEEELELLRSLDPARVYLGPEP